MNDPWETDTLLALLNQVEEVLVVVNSTPSTYTEASNDVNSQLWMTATRTETDLLTKLDTWNVVDGSQVHLNNILSTKWVFKIN